MNSHGASKYDCGRAFMHIANFVLLLLGLFMIGFGIYHLVTMDPQGVSATITGWSVQTGVNTIVSGSLAVTAGLLGFIGLVTRHRLVVLLYVIGLAVGTLMDVSALIMLSAANRAARVTVDDIRTVVSSQYGGKGTNFSTALTQSVNEYHKASSCCGWSGTGNENVFLITPWFIEANNVTKPAGKSPLTYPESCCVAQAKDKDLDLCVRATDEKQARKMGYIYALDCLDKLLSSAPMTYLRFSELVVLILLQFSCLFFAMQFLLRLFGQIDSLPSPASGRQQPQHQQQQQQHMRQQQQQQQQQKPDFRQKQPPQQRLQQQRQQQQRQQLRKH